MSTKGRKWKPGQAAKFKATMAAKRQAKTEPTTVTKHVKNPRQTDAVVYLKHAEAHITKALASGRLKKMDHAHLLTLLALTTLVGE
jgi:hypothetical protein